MKKIIFFALALIVVLSVSSFARELNMNRYITLSVKSGAEITIDFKADSIDTPVRIISGNNTMDIIVNDIWSAWKEDNRRIGDKPAITTDGNTITIYGNIVGINCSNNKEKITGIDASNNEILRDLRCTDNHITTLDLSKNTQLTSLACYSNQITSINVKECKDLYFLGCAGNKLTSLNLSNNTGLVGLNCSDNQLSKLDLSNNLAIEQVKCSKNKITSIMFPKEAKITSLTCDSNKLASIDISSLSNIEYFSCINNKLKALNLSKNTKLNYISCFDNPINSKAYNALYCSLPDRSSAKPGICFLVNTDKDKNLKATKSTNTEIAKTKNWKLLFWQNGKVIKKKQAEALIIGNSKYKCK